MSAVAMVNGRSGDTWPFCMCVIAQLCVLQPLEEDVGQDSQVRTYSSLLLELINLQRCSPLIGGAQVHEALGDCPYIPQDDDILREMHIIIYSWIESRRFALQARNFETGRFYSD